MIPIYIKQFINEPGIFLNHLLELDWLEVTSARKEYFMSDPEGISYTYGVGESARTYVSKNYTDIINQIRNKLDTKCKTNYNVCFLNRYDGPKNALGWHADDSPEMNMDHDICVISFGAEREIWWKPKDMKGNIPPENKQLLHNGSLFIMPAGFQKINFHRIPKYDKGECGVRISLTFRNYIK